MITFEELYTNCYWLVYRYVRHMIEKDLAAAEDVTQEVFLVTYQKWQEGADIRIRKVFAADS